MILSYDERSDLMRVAYYDDYEDVRVFLYDEYLNEWLTSCHDLQYKSLTGFRSMEIHKNGIAIIIHDDGEE